MAVKCKDDTFLPRYYLNCVTLDGLPLFSLTEGQLLPLPFPVIGSLNGVHMFAKGNQIELGCTTAEGAKIYWKEYGSIKLLIVNFHITPDWYLIRQLDSIYKCMVMILGAHEFSKVRNIEKLKKKVKLCFPLIKHFLKNSHLFSNVTHLTDVVIIEDPRLLQSYLNTFAEECQSEFAFLTVNGKVAVGTDKFWHLAPIETSVILHLLSSLSTLPTAVDIPIFLPHGSPTVPHRLVAVHLRTNIRVVLICGPKPPLQSILHKHIKKYWGPLSQTLSSYGSLHPRGFPPSVNLDARLLGFVLLNTTDRKSLSSVFPHGLSTGCNLTYLSIPEEREAILKSFYISVSFTLFHINEDKSAGSCKPQAKETYKCTDRYKCYALQSKNHEIYTLYGNDIQTYCLGTFTKQILKCLTKDKLL